MRLGIVGSREFLDYSLLAATVDSFVEKTKIKVEKIVSGGAKGADSLAARYASEHGYPLEEFKPDYGKYGRGAPLKRNTDIVENSDTILAFVTASSRGTWDTIRKAQAMNKIVRIYNV